MLDLKSNRFKRGVFENMLQLKKIYWQSIKLVSQPCCNQHSNFVSLLSISVHRQFWVVLPRRPVFVWVWIRLCNCNILAQDPEVGRGSGFPMVGSGYEVWWSFRRLQDAPALAEDIRSLWLHALESGISFPPPFIFVDPWLTSVYLLRAS